MDFEADENGNVVVSDRDSGDRTAGEAEENKPPPQNPIPRRPVSEGNPRPNFKVDIPGFFEDVGDFTSKLGGFITDGIGEISGANKQKKKEAEKKARELEGLANEIERIKVEIGNRAKELENSNNAVTYPDYYGTQDTQDAINNRGNDHNNDVEKTRDSLPDLGKDPEPLPSDTPNPAGARDPYPTPEKEKVRRTRDYIDSIRNSVRGTYTGNDREAREGILDTADSAADSAEDSYHSGENAEGEWKLDIARRVADLAFSSTPLFGDIYDIANALNGENFITGDPIPPEEGILQAASALASLATGGALGTIGDVRKASKVMKEIAKSAAKREAKKAGRDALDPKKEKEIDSRMDSGENAAKNALKKQTAKQFEDSVSTLPTNERVGAIRTKAKVVAQDNGWAKDGRLTKKNNRDVYTDKDGRPWGVDTYHGRWEKFNPTTGKHEGEYSFDNIYQNDSVVPNRTITL